MKMYQKTIGIVIESLLISPKFITDLDLILNKRLKKFNVDIELDSEEGHYLIHELKDLLDIEKNNNLFNQLTITASSNVQNVIINLNFVNHIFISKINFISANNEDLLLILETDLKKLVLNHQISTNLIYNNFLYPLLPLSPLILTITITVKHLVKDLNNIVYLNLLDIIALLFTSLLAGVIGYLYLSRLLLKMLPRYDLTFAPNREHKNTLAVLKFILVLTFSIIIQNLILTLLG